MTTDILKGRSYTTGTVHLARRVRHADRTVTEPMLAQDCGMTRRAVAYLAPVPADTPVTCRKCQAAEAKRVPLLARPGGEVDLQGEDPADALPGQYPTCGYTWTPAYRTCYCTLPVGHEPAADHFDNLTGARISVLPAL